MEKGFHYHALFFFDGQKVRQDITQGKLIGELWQERITDMAGLYFNCNYQKESYHELGIGLLKRTDEGIWYIPTENVTEEYQPKTNR
ncbi:hypothetical protein ABN238_02725 [Providencia rettgeri]|uniref:hypothetical protein n=1 Tax=Providencia rettgeri TaxID=587 RepID=UPI0032DAB5C4